MDEPTAAPASLTPTADDEPAATKGRRQFLDEVFPAEIEDVRRRREALLERSGGVFGAAGETPLQPTPTTANGLAGLALSGGGMRSASFNLGVLQGLERHGMLAQFDYLSTVSGGGWIGSCLSSLTRGAGAEFPFDPTNEALTPTLNHLRDRSASLVPQGIAGIASFLARFVRGIFATIVMLLPGSALTAMLMGLVVSLYVHVGGITASGGVRFPLTARLGLLALAWFVASIPVVSLWRPQGRPQKVIEQSYGIGILAVVGVALLELQPWVITRWNDFMCGGMFFQHRWVPSAAGGTALGLGVLALLVPALRGPLRALLLTVTGIASLLVPYMLFLHVSAQSFLGCAAGGHGLFRLTPDSTSHYLVVVVLYFFTDVNVLSLHPYFRERLVRTFVLQRDHLGVSRHEDLKLSALCAPGSIAPQHIINTTLNLQASADRSLRGRNGSVFVFTKRFIGSSRTGYCPTELYEHLVPGLDVGTAVAVSASAVSPNMGSMTIRPLVFLMTFLNLRLGYWLPNPSKLRTWAKLQRVTAGAPESLLERARARLTWMPRLGCYLRELISLLHERGRWIYLSDGGHLENTAAYELLRRRSRFILVSDAEEDPLMQFGGFATLMRFARLDMGIEIEIDLNDIRPAGPGGLSRRHVALGTIRYPKTERAAAETGVILYIKSSSSGDEDEIIHQYRATHADFPHQSTANQAFAEDQFEAYRALGSHIVEGLFSSTFAEGSRTLAYWFHDLSLRIVPDPMSLAEYTDLRDELEEVESLLRQPDCVGYFYEVYPEFRDGAALPAMRPEVLHEVVMRQLHLMQSMYNRFPSGPVSEREHPRNSGWIALFRRWSAAPSFRRVWLTCVHQFGSGFQQFCLDTLDLAITRNFAVNPRASTALRPSGETSSGWLALEYQLTLDDPRVAPVAVAMALIAVDLSDDAVTLRAGPIVRAPGFEHITTTAELTRAFASELARLDLPALANDDRPVTTSAPAARAIIDALLAPPEDSFG